MRQFFDSDAAKFLFTGLLAGYLVLAPLSALWAAPIISHRPVKLAQRGKPLNIIAHIAGDREIETAFLHLQYGGRSIKGKLPVLAQPASVPVRVRVIDSGVALLSAADSNSRQIGAIEPGADLYVTAVRNGFYRVYEPNGDSGYLSQSNVQILSSGRRYGAAVPASITSSNELAYRIEAIDVNGQTTETDWTAVRLITEADISAIQSGNAPANLAAPATRSAGSPFYRKPVFWLFVALTAGGAYYFLNRPDDSADETKVDIIVEWN
ncbi:hypothetical protein JW992_01835 [candidate division KSB1 bacterium]|nr:hypothetical protein [candidate division KSB1 bacterium]